MLHIVKSISSRSDIFGILISGLCLIHCMVLPVMVSMGYIYYLPDHGHWHLWDAFFVVMAFWAVKVSVSHSNSQFIKISFWITMGVFTLAVLFHEWGDTMVVLSSVSSTVLVILHLVNFFYRSKCKVMKK